MKNSFKNYPFIIKPLSSENGGGYFIEFPDLLGCISDGETIQEAIDNGFDAVDAWIKTAKSLKRKIPKPNSAIPSGEYSGKYVQRLPKSLHEELSKKAHNEGVSINQLVLTYIAKGVGFNNNNLGLS
jgi:antitoxin HicB